MRKAHDISFPMAKTSSAKKSAGQALFPLKDADPLDAVCGSPSSAGNSPRITVLAPRLKVGVDNCQEQNQVSKMDGNRLPKVETLVRGPKFSVPHQPGIEALKTLGDSSARASSIIPPSSRGSSQSPRDAPSGPLRISQSPQSSPASEKWGARSPRDSPKTTGESEPDDTVLEMDDGTKEIMAILEKGFKAQFDHMNAKMEKRLEDLTEKLLKDLESKVKDVHGDQETAHDNHYVDPRHA